MVRDDRPTYGWYYNSVNDRASAWTGVSQFCDFVVYPGYLEWDAGPEGSIVVRDQAEEGDVIQYDWEPNTLWDHSMIIVDTRYIPYEGHYYHWVDCMKALRHTLYFGWKKTPKKTEAQHEQL